MQYIKNKDKDAHIVSLEKAFSRIEWIYLFKVLYNFFFPETFIYLVKLPYKSKISDLSKWYTLVCFLHKQKYKTKVPSVTTVVCLLWYPWLKLLD